MLFKRGILEDIVKWVPRDEIIILTGPRQSGKTSILKMMERDLKGNGEEVFFFNMEDFEILHYLNQSPANLLNLLNKKNGNKVFVFLDEVQYLDNPTNFLKYIYDEYKDSIKLIVSGSSAFYIDKKFKDSLAGRKRIFQILPLNFSDFLFFKGEEELISLATPFLTFERSIPDNINPIKRKKLVSLLEEYMIWGGYPKVVTETDRGIKIELLREILNSYVKKDIDEADIRSPEKFLFLMKIFADQMGSLVNENELSITLGMSSTAVKHYIYIMKKSFHIKIMEPFFLNTRKEITKMPKVYYFDNGLRNVVLNLFEPMELRVDRGKLFENTIFKMLVDNFGMDAIRFWRSQAQSEVDFIVEREKLAFEVKYNAGLLKKGKYTGFMRQYPDFKFYLVFHQGDITSESTGIEMLQI